MDIEEQSLSTKINNEVVNLFYKYFHSIILGDSLGALAFSALLWNEVNHKIIIVWAVLQISIDGIFRQIYTSIYHFYRKRGKLKNYNRWKWMYISSALISGSFWAAGGFLYLFVDDPFFRLLILTFLVGVVGAGIPSIIPSKAGCVLFLFPIFIAIMFLSLSLSPFILSMLLAMSIVIFCSMVIFTTFMINDMLLESITVKCKNEYLSKSLESMNTRLEEEMRMREQQHKEMIIIARRAGMADVATSVLHNVGNILTSVNVSASLLKEKLSSSEFLDALKVLNKNIKDHAHDLARYLTADPRGKHLAEYLKLLEEMIAKENMDSEQEIDLLIKNINHIKDVITMQQGLVNIMGVIEPVFIDEQIEAAISIVGFDSSYTIERHYEQKEKIALDKIKLMQILVNLVRNAKDAIIEKGEEGKKLIFIAKRKSKDNFQIKLIDNGIGIAPENLPHVFTFGFTTKKKGHGFGLHTSALLAKEMGGVLTAESEGHGKGATFTLVLPFIFIKPE